VAISPLDPPLIRFMFLDLTCFIVRNVLSHPLCFQIQSALLLRNLPLLTIPEAVYSLVQDFSLCGPWPTREPGKNWGVTTCQRAYGDLVIPGTIAWLYAPFRILWFSIEECKKNNNLKYVKTSVDKKISFGIWNPWSMR